MGSNNTGADITYTTNGLFYRIIPQTKEAEAVFHEIARHFEDGAIPCTAWEGTVRQIRAAGYSVRKAPKVKPGELDALLAELEG